MKQVRPYTKYGAIVPIIFSFVRMDNIESLKLDEIDIFLEEKISDEPPVNDERIARVLTESNRLFNHIVSQIIYLYYQSFHYDFGLNCKNIHLLIKRLHNTLSHCIGI